MMRDADHRHCKVCGAVTKPGNDTCSDACADVRARRMASAKNQRYVLYGLIAFILVLFIASYAGV
ncbi:MAG TPA: DUF2116 family Zn-ribbon domain-containing protein [Thermoplasmata archaeon]|nr:DUF2116 family Zn-ribbon domain-containing protein [Thermoplasmata archaeon]